MLLLELEQGSVAVQGLMEGLVVMVAVVVIMVVGVVAVVVVAVAVIAMVADIPDHRPVEHREVLVLCVDLDLDFSLPLRFIVEYNVVLA